MAKIIIAEDEKNQRVMLAEFLRNEAYEVFESENGLEAMELLAKHDKIDAVISDIQMPRMDGIQLVKKINDEYPDVLIILATGYGTVELSVEALQHGAADFIPKPIDINRLKRSLSAGLGRQRQMTEEHELMLFSSGLLSYRIPAKQHAYIGALAGFLGRMFHEHGYISSGKRHSTITILYEAISNSIYHGTLGVPSQGLRTDDGDSAYEAEIEKRASSPEFADKSISVSAMMEREFVMVTVSDEGAGFDWRKEFEYANDPENIFSRPYGRGLLMMEGMLGNNFHFNDKGNLLSLIFEKGD